MIVILIILFSLALILLIWILAAQPVKKVDALLNHDLLHLSSQLLYKIKMNEPVARIEQELSCFTTLSLQEGLPDDAARKVIWINLYNAYYQLFSIRDKKKACHI